MPTPGVHLHPTAEIAPRALLPGDPGRALALAQVLLDAPRMCNHHRGLWGYTGTAADGEALTIQATGMGGPSAAIVLEELADLGVRLVVRVGTATALDPALAPGTLLAVAGALAEDGTSHALGTAGRVEGDPGLAAALATAAGRAGVVVSADLFYASAAEAPGRAAGWRAAGAAAVDLETAALLAVAQRRGLRAGSLLAIAATADGRRLDADGASAAGLALGAAAGRALGLPEPVDDADVAAPAPGEAA